MKLLVVTDNFPPRWDGIGRFLTETLPALSETFDITVLAPDYGEYPVPNVAVEKVRLSQRIVGDYTVPKTPIRKAWRLVGEADIVFTQSLGAIGGLAAVYAKLRGKQHVHYTHSVEWRLLPNAIKNPEAKHAVLNSTKWFTKRIYRSADRLLVPSEDVKETIEWEGVTTPTTIIPLGVDTEAFKPRMNKEEVEELRAKHGVPTDKVVIGYHGRLAREKNVRTLLRASKRLEKIGEDFHVVLIGDGVPSIVEAAEKQRFCTHIPAKKDIQDYIHLYDVYVSCSLTETTSLSTAEAMAAGKPVIATPAGYIGQYVEPDVNGYLFPFKDSYVLSTKLHELIRDEEKRRRLGEQARKTAKTTFNWDRTAKLLKQALKKEGAVKE